MKMKSCLHCPFLFSFLVLWLLTSCELHISLKFQSSEPPNPPSPVPTVPFRLKTMYSNLPQKGGGEWREALVCVLCCDGISNKPPRLTELNKNTLSNLISSRLPAPPLTPVATATPWGDEPHIPRPDDGLSRPRPGYGGGRLGVHWCEG